MQLNIADPDSDRGMAGYWSIEYVNDDGDVDADLHLSRDVFEEIGETWVDMVESGKVFDLIDALEDDDPPDFTGPL